MESDLAQEAINAALSCNWERAISLNTKLLKLNPNDIDALNRIARAYAESGNLKKAKEKTDKVLRIDPANRIALKAEQRWKNFKQDGKNLGSTSPTSFIEDPTRTRIVSLINTGEEINIDNLDCGDLLKLEAHAHRVNVLSSDDKYIGRFPDNLALKFINLIKFGGVFEIAVKSAEKHEVKVLVRALTKNGF